MQWAVCPKCYRSARIDIDGNFWEHLCQAVTEQPKQVFPPLKTVRCTRCLGTRWIFRHHHMDVIDTYTKERVGHGSATALSATCEGCGAKVRSGRRWTQLLSIYMQWLEQNKESSK